MFLFLLLLLLPTALCVERCVYWGDYLLEELNIDGANTWFYNFREELVDVFDVTGREVVIRDAHWHINVIRNRDVCFSFAWTTYNLEIRNPWCHCLQRLDKFKVPFFVFLRKDRNGIWTVYRKDEDTFTVVTITYGPEKQYPEGFCFCEKPYEDKLTYYQLSNNISTVEAERPLTSCILSLHKRTEFTFPCQFKSHKAIVVINGTSRYFKEISELEGLVFVGPVYAFSISVDDTDVEKQGRLFLKFARTLTKSFPCTAIIFVTDGYEEFPESMNNIRCFGVGDGGQLCITNQYNIETFWQLGISESPLRQDNFIPSSLYFPIYDYIYDRPTPPCKAYGICVKSLLYYYTELIDFLNRSLSIVHTSYVLGSECPTVNNYSHTIAPVSVDLGSWPNLRKWVEVTDLRLYVPCCYNNGWEFCRREQIPCPTDTPVAEESHPPIHCFAPPYRGTKFVTERFWEYYVSLNQTRHNKIKGFTFDIHEPEIL